MCRPEAVDQVPVDGKWSATCFGPYSGQMSSTLSAGPVAASTNIIATLVIEGGGTYGSRSGRYIRQSEVNAPATFVWEGDDIGTDACRPS